MAMLMLLLVLGVLAGDCVAFALAFFAARRTPATKPGTEFPVNPAQGAGGVTVGAPSKG